MIILRQLSHMIRLHRAIYGKLPLSIHMGPEAFRDWKDACNATCTVFATSPVDIDKAHRNEYEGIEVIEDREMPYPDRVYLMTQPVVDAHTNPTTRALFDSPTHPTA